MCMKIIVSYKGKKVQNIFRHFRTSFHKCKTALNSGIFHFEKCETAINSFFFVEDAMSGTAQ